MKNKISLSVNPSVDGFAAEINTFNQNYSVFGKTKLSTLKKTIVEVIADLDKATKMQDQILKILLNKKAPQYFRKPLIEKVGTRSASVKVFALNKAYTGKGKDLAAAYQDVIVQALKDLNKINYRIEEVDCKLSFY